MCYKNRFFFFYNLGINAFLQGNTAHSLPVIQEYAAALFICFRLSLLVRNPTQTQKYQKVPMLTGMEKSVYFKSLVCAKVCYTKAL